MNSPRKGRFNTTIQVDTATIEKVAHVIEANRPIRLGVEAWALNIAKERGLVVPTVYRSFHDPEGREVLRLERIEGTPLDKISDYRTRARAMFDVGRQLLALTNVAPTFGWIDIKTSTGSHGSWRQFLIDYADKYVTKVTQHGLLASDLGQKLFQMTLELDNGPVRASLVHRDIKPGNLLVRPNGGTTILDWENAILGDSLYDLAMYEIREGQGLASSEFVKGHQAEAASKTHRYRLYEAIALLGITDFLWEYGDNAEDQAARLSELLDQL